MQTAKRTDLARGVRAAPFMVGLASLSTLGACASDDDAASGASGGASPGASVGASPAPEPVVRVAQPQAECPAAAGGARAPEVVDPYALRTCAIPGVSHTIPTVPSEIALPEGLTLLGGYRGVGTVFLQCSPVTLPDGTPDMSGAGEWTLRADKVSAATLYGDDCTIVGTLDFLSGLTRGARFSWIDGSQFFGGRTNAGVLPAGVTAGLPWILQPRSRVLGSGFLSDVAYVHRTDTAGGVDPEGPCVPSAYPNGVLLPFEATYSFYVATPAEDAGAPDAAPE